MKKAALLLTAVLAACGGGGNNSTLPTPAPTPSPTVPSPSPDPTPSPSPGAPPVTPDGKPAPATFTPALLEMDALEGDTVSSSVDLSHNIATNETLNVRIEVPALFNPAVSVRSYGQTANATLNLSKSAPAGIHTGVIKVQLCRDLPQDCNRPYLSSPWVLPYKITVHSIGPKLTDLHPLSGQPEGWTQDYGNARSSSNIDTTEIFDPTKFSVRWHKRPANPAPMDPVFVAQGGVVSVQKGNLNEIGRTLEAFSEASGELVWRRSISSYSRGAVIVQGRIYLLEFVNPSLSQLNSYELSTGSRLVLADTSDGGDQLLVADTNSIYGRSPVLRWDAITGNLLWKAAPSAESFQPNRMVRSGDYLYAYAIPGVQRFDVATGARTPLTPATSPSAGGHKVSADRRGNLFTSFDAGGWVSVRRFSTETNTQVWQRDLTNSSVNLYSAGGHAVDTNSLYLGVKPYGEHEAPFIWAFSTSDGVDKWRKNIPGLAQNVSLVSAGNLLFASSYSPEATRTVALDKNTGEIVWSIPVAGSLALSENGTLYIARATYFNEGGSLTAINLR